MEAKELAIAVVGPNISPDKSLALQERCANTIREQAGAVVRHAVSRWAASEKGFDPTLSTDLLAAIFAFRELDVAVQTRISLHPAFRYWLQAMRRTSRGDQPEREREFAQALVDFVWVEQAIAGKLERQWSLIADDRGGLRCPGRARYIELGANYAGMPVTAQAGAEGIELLCHDSRRISIPLAYLQQPENGSGPNYQGEGYTVSLAPLAAEKIEVWSRDPWLRVDYTGTNQRATGVQFFGTRDELYTSDDPEPFRESLALLEKIWPEQHHDLGLFTHVIVPMKPSPDAYRAFTVSSRQGAIFVDSIAPHLMVENLIHENAHVKLRQIQLLDSLLTDPADDTRRFPVPWRPDPRPIPGILEGLWVFSHVAEYRWQSLVQDHTADKAASFNSLVKDLVAAREIIKEHAQLTDVGKAFLQAMGQWVEHLQQRIRA